MLRRSYRVIIAASSPVGSSIIFESRDMRNKSGFCADPPGTQIDTGGGAVGRVSGAFLGVFFGQRVTTKDFEVFEHEVSMTVSEGSLLCIFVKSKMISAAVADDVASLPACGTGARSDIMLSIYPNFPLFCRSARMTQKTFLSSRAGLP